MCPFPSILFQGGTFATILRRFLLLTAIYVYDSPFTRSPLSLAVPITALISRRYRCCLRLFFDVDPHPLTRFIVGRLLHPCRRNWLSFVVAFFSTVLHCQLIFASAFPPSGLALYLAVASVSGFRRPWFSFRLRLLQALALTGLHRRMIASPLPQSRQTRTPFQRVYPDFFFRLSSQAQISEVKVRS